MVGRKLPNSRPNGEDHRGAVSEGMGILRNPGRAVPGWKNWDLRERWTLKALVIVQELWW